MKRTYKLIAHIGLLLGVFWCSNGNADLPNMIEKIKPAIVAIGTFHKTQSPPFSFRGTGFVIANGNKIATNAHVLPEAGPPEAPELAVLIRSSTGEGSIRRAKLLSKDVDHDLAILYVDGPPLPALSIGNSTGVREGQEIAFIGFPIGGVLGFSPVTHRGIISALTPIAIPGANSNQINEKLIKQIRKGTFNVFQLDATAYPGNSGSPVFNTESGEVIGVINMVFVKGTKEAVLSNPSGISYAIPANYLTELLR
ncbi:serine protease [Dechloromonas sp. XY25]|uniref:Serine protease n=1 Tax=Dechloromonas hankyongensis TaxID=2908002 RepID=A0ABS9K3K9_9RHOO|nr:serine protease [Dechloromonas hankyongensis]MCG2577774.1 serine protease [Dechloromonas hankyongensis]